MSKLSLKPHRDSELILEAPSEPMDVSPLDVEELSDESPSDLIEALESTYQGTLELTAEEIECLGLERESDTYSKLLLMLNYARSTSLSEEADLYSYWPKASQGFTKTLIKKDRRFN